MKPLIELGTRADGQRFRLRSDNLVLLAFLIMPCIYFRLNWGMHIRVTSLLLSVSAGRIGMLLSRVPVIPESLLLVGLDYDVDRWALIRARLDRMLAYYTRYIMHSV